MYVPKYLAKSRVITAIQSSVVLTFDGPMHDLGFRSTTKTILGIFIIHKVPCFAKLWLKIMRCFHDTYINMNF